MLNVNTLPKETERWRINVPKTTTETKDENERRRRKTKTASIEKEQKKKLKKRLQNKCVSSQTKWEKRGRYRSGVSPTFPQLAVSSSGWTGSVLHGDLTLQEAPIKYCKCPTNDTKQTWNVKRETWNVKRETWNAGNFQSSDCPKTDDKWNKKMQLSLRTD
jgi:hypothetical protein